MGQTDWKRMYRIDMEQCGCEERLIMIASIEEPLAIDKILEHLDQQVRGPSVL
jgi:hypothetical protein